MQILTTPVFSERKKRTEWLYSHFKHLFNKSSVLDVGCYEAPMRDFIGRKNYIGIDFVGNPDIKIKVTGHTDLTGDLEANKKLSWDRAESVRKYLVSKGVETKKIISGEHKNI